MSYGSVNTKSRGLVTLKDSKDAAIFGPTPGNDVILEKRGNKTSGRPLMIFQSEKSIPLHPVF